MSAADAIGRAAEVQAAFLEGWRKALSMRGWYSSDRDAWNQSLARSRLAYGIFPACPSCGCQVINVDAKMPTCLKCGSVRMSPTTQRRARDRETFETNRVDEILRRPLARIGDGRDFHPPPP